MRSPTVKVCPVMEAMAKCLVMINTVPLNEQEKMIKRAAKMGAIAAKKVQQDRCIIGFLAWVGSDFRVKIELEDLKTYITTGHGRYELGQLIEARKESHA